MAVCITCKYKQMFKDMRLFALHCGLYSATECAQIGLSASSTMGFSLYDY